MEQQTQQKAVTQAADKELSGPATRASVLAFVAEQYGTVPDYPWQDDPESAVLRHADNRKWYGVILPVKREKLKLPVLTDAKDTVTEVLNVKCDPILIGSLRSRPGFLPAYHMNKDFWISLLLDGTVSMADAAWLLGQSFQATAAPAKATHHTKNRRRRQGPRSASAL